MKRHVATVKLDLLNNALGLITNIVNQIEGIKEEEDIEVEKSKEPVDVKRKDRGNQQHVSKKTKNDSSKPHLRQDQKEEEEEDEDDEDDEEEAIERKEKHVKFEFESSDEEEYFEDSITFWHRQYSLRRPLTSSEIALLTSVVNELVYRFETDHKDESRSYIEQLTLDMIRPILSCHGNVGSDFSTNSIREYKDLSEVDFIHCVAAYFNIHKKYLDMCKSTCGRIGVFKHAAKEHADEFATRSPLSRAFVTGAKTAEPSAYFEEIAQKLMNAVLHVKLQQSKKASAEASNRSKNKQK